MNKIVLVGFILFVNINISSQTVPQVSAGSIRHFEKFPSEYVDTRNVDVWLPDGYSPKKKYSVLYMHDGQMLFDASITWNKTAWEVDDVFGKLLKEKKIKDCIVVGVWNVKGKRTADYYPQKVIDMMPENKQKEIFKD